MDNKEMRNHAQCALCLQYATLCKSHIIPRFVGNWLKNSSATGYFRSTKNPNIRCQDTTTEYLLCAACEQKLSKCENKFATKIFYPFQNYKPDKFPYGDWLLYFAVSLAWRTALQDREWITSKAPICASELNEAIEIWRLFLSGSGTVGVYQHHLIFFDYLSPQNPNAPKNIHWYMLSSIDVGLYYDGSKVFSYCKLPGMAIWSAINPPQRSGLKGTIIKKRGVIARKQSIGDPAFTGILQMRNQETVELMSNISPGQANNIHQSALKNPMKVACSHSLQVAMAEEFWDARSKNQDG